MSNPASRLAHYVTGKFCKLRFRLGREYKYKRLSRAWTETFKQHKRRAAYEAEEYAFHRQIAWMLAPPDYGGNH